MTWLKFTVENDAASRTATTTPPTKIAINTIAAITKRLVSELA